jgi:hypothetical protein
MNILLVTAGYSIFDAKGQLNGFLSYLTDKTLSEKGPPSPYSSVITKVKLLWADIIIYIMPVMWFNMPAPLNKINFAKNMNDCILLVFWRIQTNNHQKKEAFF